MKTKVKNNIIAALMFAFTLLITACERTQLCYNHYPSANLALSWEKEWERDYGMSHPTTWDAAYHGFDYESLRPGTPEWVNLLKYRGDNNEGEDYFTPSGGDIILEEKDNRSFLLYNGDTEYIILSDIATLPQARASATPRSRSSLSYIKERHPGTRSSNPPDVLFAAYLPSVPSLKIHEMQTLPVKMQPLVYTYVIRYEFEYGVQHIQLARGALAGMAESVYLRDGHTSDESIIVLYDCDVNDWGCSANVRTFGIPGFPDEYYGRDNDNGNAAPERPYTLNLEVLLTFGKTMEFNFDIADQLKKQPRGGVITIKGIRIEDTDNTKPITSGDFDVDVDGWGHEDVDLPV